MSNQNMSNQNNKHKKTDKDKQIFHKSHVFFEEGKIILPWSISYDCYQVNNGGYTIQLDELCQKIDKSFTKIFGKNNVEPIKLKLIFELMKYRTVDYQHKTIDIEQDTQLGFISTYNKQLEEKDEIIKTLNAKIIELENNLKYQNESLNLTNLSLLNKIQELEQKEQQKEQNNVEKDCSNCLVKDNQINELKDSNTKLLLENENLKIEMDDLEKENGRLLNEESPQIQQSKKDNKNNFYNFKDHSSHSIRLLKNINNVDKVFPECSEGKQKWEPLQIYENKNNDLNDLNNFIYFKNKRKHKSYSHTLPSNKKIFNPYNLLNTKTRGLGKVVKDRIVLKLLNKEIKNLYDLENIYIKGLSKNKLNILKQYFYDMIFDKTEQNFEYNLPLQEPLQPNVMESNLPI